MVVIVDYITITTSYISYIWEQCIKIKTQIKHQLSTLTRFNWNQRKANKVQVSVWRIEIENGPFSYIRLARFTSYYFWSNQTSVLFVCDNDSLRNKERKSATYLIHVYVSARQHCSYIVFVLIFNAQQRIK